MLWMLYFKRGRQRLSSKLSSNKSSGEGDRENTRVKGFFEQDRPDPAIFSACVRCGLCLPHCRTYLETLRETSSPRGRIHLIQAVSEGRLSLTSPGFVGQMYQCLDCRACEDVCPSGVQYGRLVETARTQIERARPRP